MEILRPTKYRNTTCPHTIRVLHTLGKYLCAISVARKERKRRKKRKTKHQAKREQEMNKSRRVPVGDIDRTITHLQVSGALIRRFFSPATNPPPPHTHTHTHTTRHTNKNNNKITTTTLQAIQNIVSVDDSAEQEERRCLGRPDAVIMITEQ